MEAFDYLALEVVPVREKEKTSLEDIVKHTNQLVEVPIVKGEEIIHYQIRETVASDPHSISLDSEAGGRHRVLWIIKHKGEDATQSPDYESVGWQEFYQSPELVDGMIIQFEFLIQQLRDKYGGENVVGGFHIGYPTNQDLELLRQTNGNFQKKPGLQTVECVHWYGVAFSDQEKAVEFTRKLIPDNQVDAGLIAKQLDIAGVVATEEFKDLIEEVASRYQGVKVLLPFRQGRTEVYEFNTIREAMFSALEMQSNISDKWVDGVKELATFATSLMREHPDVFGGIPWALFEQVKDHVKQFIVPSMLVATSPQGKNHLCPLSAGNAAAELYGRYTIIRPTYDGHHYDIGHKN